MHRAFYIATILSIFSASAHADTFTIDELAPDQSCYCGCFMVLSHEDALPRSNGWPPLIFTDYNFDGKMRGEMHLAGKPVITARVSAGHYVSDDGQTQIRADLKFVETLNSDTFEEKVSGSLSVTHRGQTRNVKVKGLNVC